MTLADRDLKAVVGERWYAVEVDTEAFGVLYDLSPH